jgi:ABC-2 type transport system ATP-binding protein
MTDSEKSTATAAVELQNISMSFGAVRALEGLTLTVPRGTVFGFLGPNGAGKTTTLRILLGLLRPLGGSALVLGLDPAVDGMRVRGQVGVLLENDGLYDRLSAVDNLEYHGRIHHLARDVRKTRSEELLRSFDLWDRRDNRVNTWSKGMRQKLAIARTLLHRPPLLLLDEPFTGLDPVAAADLRTNIVNLAREDGATVFLTTHDLAHVEKSCTQVAVLKGGRVLAAGAPDELAAGRSAQEVAVAGSGLTDELLAAMKRDGLIQSFERATDASARPNAARVTCAPESRARLGTELMQRGVVLEELHTVRASLEDAFLSLMHDGGANVTESRP